MSDVTQILAQMEAGDANAAEQLLPLVYQELRQLAAAKMRSERTDHTLQATALVHEAYVRLFDPRQVPRFASRGHFFSAAAEAMRRILIESARRRSSLKRGGQRQRVTMEQVEQVDDAVLQTFDPDLLLDLDASLCRLANEDPAVAELVKLRLFAGFSVPEAGKLLGMSRSTAYQNWTYVRAWFAVQGGSFE